MQGNRSEKLCVNSNYSEIKTNYKHSYRRKSKIKMISALSALNYFVIMSIYYLQGSLVEASIVFNEFNQRISKQLKNDRPCNFLLNPRDSKLATNEIVAKYGYPSEQHWVTTEDGYILEVHRIPARKQLEENGKPAPAVFLMHGIVSSSRDFVINCDRRALAFELWDNGYDVWMGNYRGGPYGRNHTKLKTNSVKFWDFSADQIGYYDVPAMIDHVLKTTTLKQVSYVAHSMGNGVGLIMLTLRPEYNDKINTWFALSAATTLQNTGSPLLRIAAAFPRSVEWALRTFNHGELLPPLLVKLMTRFIPMLCRREGKMHDYHGLCAFIYFLNDGYDPGQVPPEALSIITGNYPTSTASKFIVQWMQWIISGNFAMYDEGPMKNMKKYGKVTPMMFPIQNLRTPTVLFYGENDWIVSARDIEKTNKLVKELRPDSESPLEMVKVEAPNWNHADFIFGKDADILVYSHILKRLRLIYPDHNLNHNRITNNNDESHRDAKNNNKNSINSHIKKINIKSSTDIYINSEIYPNTESNSTDAEIETKKPDIITDGTKNVDIVSINADDGDSDSIGNISSETTDANNATDPDIETTDQVDHDNENPNTTNESTSIDV